jgi:hypothetical protein
MSVNKKELQKGVIDLPDAPTNSFADLSKNLINEFFNSTSLSVWLFGSIILITIYLISQGFSSEDVYFPFFKKTANNNLLLPFESLPHASTSAIVNMYGYLGEIKFTFNDLNKIFLLVFIIYMLISKLIKKLFNWLTFNLPFMTGFQIFSNSFFESKWLADPQPITSRSDSSKFLYRQLRHKIPVILTNFRLVKFNIKILGEFDHWRAGIFVSNIEKSKNYVFHLYKNKNDDQLRTRITELNYDEGKHINQSDQNIQVNDMKNFLFEVKKNKKDFYNLYINGQLVDTYIIPSDNFKILEIAAWADDLPYKYEFNNIKVLG